MDKSEEKITLFGCPEEPKHWMYRTDDGVIVREVAYDVVRGGKPVEIVQIASINSIYRI